MSVILQGLSKKFRRLKIMHNIKKISLMDLPGQYRLVEKQVLPRIREVLKSGRYIMGPEVTKFEENFAKYCQAKYCIGTSSGTESLFLSLMALGVGREDEVITVPNTFTATAEVIVLVGATPIFCDIDPKTANMDPKSLKSKITKKTKAVIPVHLHGNPVDLDEIYKLTKPKKIAVIEDAAQAHGGRYKGKIIGSNLSELTCFSFHPVKNLGAFGDGGAVVTNNKKLAEVLRKLINHGRENHYFHSLIGTTGRLDAIQGAILDIKLKYLDKWIEKKSKLVEYYRKKLSDICKFIETTKSAKSAHHVVAVLTPKRDELAKYLKSFDIETGIHYPISLHLQPAYKFLGLKKGDFPFAEKYARETLSLPLYPHMKQKEIDFVIEKVRQFYEG